MDSLKTILEREIAGYVRHGLNGYSYLISDSAAQAYTVVSIGFVDSERIASADLIVRLVGQQVVIDRDENYPPLVETLVAASVPREQIVLAYEGEPTPEITSIAS
jgi:hypothetical protein